MGVRLLIVVALMALTLYGIAMLVRRATRAKGEIPYRRMPVRYMAAWFVLNLLLIGYQHFSYYGSAAALSVGMIVEVITAALVVLAALAGIVSWRPLQARQPAPIAPAAAFLGRVLPRREHLRRRPLRNGYAPQPLGDYFH